MGNLSLWVRIKSEGRTTIHRVGREFTHRLWRWAGGGQGDRKPPNRFIISGILPFLHSHLFVTVYGRLSLFLVAELFCKASFIYAATHSV